MLSYAPAGSPLQPRRNFFANAQNDEFSVARSRRFDHVQFSGAPHEVGAEQRSDGSLRELPRVFAKMLKIRPPNI
jgi:hypothetical protein